MCGCDWHEHYGVKIDTLDNPGWAFEIDLADYPTTPPSFEPITEGSDDKTFMNCWI